MTNTTTSGAADLTEALRSIQRFEVVDCIDDKHVPAVIPKPHGPWVRYEDHIAALAAGQQPHRSGCTAGTDEACVQRGCGTNCIAVSPQADSVPAVEREQERIAFKAAHRHLDLDEVPDGWGRPMFKHSHVEASWLGWIARASHGQAPATQQPEGDVVAYLDVGANGYLDLGAALSEDALQQLPKGRHALVIAGTYGIDGYVAAPQPSPTTKPALQQEAQEPMATLHCNDVGYVWARATGVGKRMRFEQPLNLYAAPQPAPAPLSEMPYEKRKAIQEGEQIGASDAWFKARHEMLDTVDRRNVFRAGFDRGWSAALAAQGGKA